MSNRLHIVLTIPCLFNGGTELQTLSLVKSLKSLGHNLSVICYFEYDKLIISKFRQEGAEVLILNLIRKDCFLKIIPILIHKFKSLRPDIVHVQYMAPGALPIIAARLAGVKTVFATVHQPFTFSHGWFSKISLRMSSLLTTRFIAVSLNTEESWFGAAHLFNETQNIYLQPHHFTIYNSVDADKIKKIVARTKCQELKGKLKIPLEVPLVGVISRLRYEKGIDLLLDSCYSLKKDGINFHLLIVGSGPDETVLKKQVYLNGISGNVSFYGSAEWEIAMELLIIMDIVIVPSRFEGFGLTAAEAMVAGKPVVASDTTGLKEVVINEETGILFPVGDVQTLKQSLERLILDPSLREIMGKAGKIRSSEYFSMDKFRTKINALYSN
jgi:L-malate glycosyltransferase